MTARGVGASCGPWLPEHSRRARRRAVRPQLTIVDARKVLARSGPTFRSGESEIVAARRLVVTADMVAADSYCADLMAEVDPTFVKANRVQRQLDYAAHLGLGEPDLTKVEIVEID